MHLSKTNPLKGITMANMSELENKFIMMSRIAILLNRKGFTSSVYLSNSGPCSLITHFDDEIVESIYSWDVTEEELLNWWSIIEG